MEPRSWRGHLSQGRDISHAEMISATIIHDAIDTQINVNKFSSQMIGSFLVQIQLTQTFVSLILPGSVFFFHIRPLITTFRGALSAVVCPDMPVQSRYSRWIVFPSPESSSPLLATFKVALLHPILHQARVRSPTNACIFQNYPPFLFFFGLWSALGFLM